MALLVGVGPAMAQILPRSGNVSGQVASTKGGEEGRLLPERDWRDIEVRQDVAAGDTLRTNATGSLAVVFADGTQVRLGRNTTLVVNEVRARSPSSVRVESGSVWGRSPRGAANLTVETPAATAAIRGTEWAVSAEGDASTLQVISGEVEFFNDLGRLLVVEGQAARAEAGFAPTRLVLANPPGREQMLLYLRLEDGLDLVQTDSPEFILARTRVHSGDVEGAQAGFLALSGAQRETDQALGAYGAYVTALRLGQSPPPLPSGEGAVALLSRILALAYEGDLRGALALSDQAMTLHPDDASLIAARARILLLVGDPNEALVLVDQASGDQPDTAVLMALRAELLNDVEHQPREALVLAEQAAQAAPDDVRALAVLSDAWFELGGYAEAMSAIEQAITLQPQNVSLLARRASLLLRQNELTRAKAQIDDGLALAPDLPVLHQLLAEYLVRTGDLEGARAEALAASSGNPSYGPGFVPLAEISYDLGEPVVALQQLDTADRLDPNSPDAPLARTAIALHQYEAGDAIESSQEALRRFRSRGGQYGNLAQNQESGSLVSQAYRFLNLEAWGRYYGDRVFDSFSATSYPDQAINASASPFFVRGEDGSFDAFDGVSDTLLSSFLQGAVLEPLTVISPERELTFSSRDFVEFAAEGSLVDERERNLGYAQISATGLRNGAIPIGFHVYYEGNRLTDTLPQVEFNVPLDQRTTDNTQAFAFFGAEITPSDNLVAMVSLDSEQVARRFNFANGEAGIDDLYPYILSDERSRALSLTWGRELGYRNMIIAGLFYVNSQTGSLIDERFDARAVTFDANVDFLLLSLNHAFSRGDLDVRYGVEAVRTDISILQKIYDRPEFGAFDPDQSVLTFQDSSDEGIDETRAYVDLRYAPRDGLIFQGQLSHYSEHNPINVLPGGGDSLSYLGLTLGAAFEPRPGHWLRVGLLDRTESEQPFSYAPVTAVGLQGLTVPVEQNARVKTTVARWDAQWTRRFFTAVEYHHQEIGALSYEIPSTTVTIRGDRADLDRLAIEANLWLRDNIGVRARYAWANARARDPFFSGTNLNNPAFQNVFPVGARLPYVAEGGGQFSFVWVAPAPTRLSTELQINYYGERPGDLGNILPDYTLVDFSLEWEPFDRRMFVEASVLNLFDRAFDDAAGLPGPGRILSLTIGVRR